MLKTGEMLKILKLQNSKLERFPGHVKDVKVFGGNFRGSSGATPRKTF